MRFVCPICRNLLKRKELLLPVIERLSQLELFDAIIPLSALKQTGLEALREEVDGPLAPAYMDVMFWRA